MNVTENCRPAYKAHLACLINMLFAVLWGPSDPRRGPDVRPQRREGGPFDASRGHEDPEWNRGDGDKRLRERPLVGDSDIDPRLVARRRDRLEPLERTAGELHRGAPRGQVDHPHVAPEHPSP